MCLLVNLEKVNKVALEEEDSTGNLLLKRWSLCLVKEAKTTNVLWQDHLMQAELIMVSSLEVQIEEEEAEACPAEVIAEEEEIEDPSAVVIEAEGHSVEVIEGPSVEVVIEAPSVEVAIEAPSVEVVIEGHSVVEVIEAWVHREAAVIEVAPEEALEEALEEDHQEDGHHHEVVEEVDLVEATEVEEQLEAEVEEDLALDLAQEDDTD